MSENGGKRAVQKQGDKSFRFNIPKPYIEDVLSPEQIKNKSDYEDPDDTLFWKRSGDYLILSPNDQDEKQVRELDLEGLDELLSVKKQEHDDKEIFDRYIGKMIQSMIVSTADEVLLNMDGDMTSISEYDIHEALDSYERRDLDINTREGRITIYDRGPSGSDSPRNDMELFIDEVGEFLELHLTRPLEICIDESEMMFGRVSEQLKEKEKDESMDFLWSRATRNSADRVLNLDYEYFPRETGAFLIGKYLEMIVDITKRLVDALKHLEEESDIPEELVIDVEKNLWRVLSHGERMDKQVPDVTRASYNLDVRPKDYREQLETYNERLEILDEFRYSQDSVNGLDGLEPGKIREYGVSVGELSTLTERLIRFPRSIVLAGNTAREIADVHDFGQDYSG